ncbi:MAG: M24 family metallopeptidase, partial [Acidimicrobiales bacterium]
MTGKIHRSLADHTPAMAAAAGDGHHLAMGPGPDLEAEWQAAGLELPDLPALRQYRVDRTVAQLQEMGYDGVIVMDPMNIRYVSDTTNMQVWVMHNGARYAYVSADGYVIVWDYANCEFLSGHSHVVDEVRPAIASTYFIAGPRYEEQARRWADELVDIIESRAGKGARIAIDQATLPGYRALESRGITLGSGQELMELARRIKGPDEMRAMRCASHACLATMDEMYGSMAPGMTEREVWSMLHAGNIRRAGEWIETQIIASGPRTNPWFQEASSRVIESGDIVAYDTDLVGAYGMMIDISRTWVAGDVAPTAEQRHIHELAVEMVRVNAELLTAGRTFRELTFDSISPPREDYRHYSVIFHG